MKYYVYQLVDSLTGNVFYIGKGSGSRLNQHEVDARGNKNSYKLNKIRSIWRKGGKVIKRKIGLYASELRAYQREAELIAVTPGLTNIKHGEIRHANTAIGRRLYAASLLVDWNPAMAKQCYEQLRHEGGRLIDLLNQQAYMGSNYG